MSASVLCVKGQTDGLPSVSRLQVSVFASDPRATRITRLGTSSIHAHSSTDTHRLHVPRIIHRTLQRARVRERERERENSPRSSIVPLYSAAAVCVLLLPPPLLLLLLPTFVYEHLLLVSR